MSIVEFIGFLITITAFFLLVIRKSLEDRRRKRHPEKYGDEGRQEDVLRDFLKSLDMDMEEGAENSKRKRAGSAKMQKQAEEVEEFETELDQEKAGKYIKKPHRKVADQFQFQTKYDRYQPKTAIEARSYEREINHRYDTYSDERVVSQDLRGFKPEKVYNVDPYKIGQYDVIAETDLSRAKKILKNAHSRRDMIVIQQILNTPKALRTCSK
jgi:hypothetical protein